MISETAQMATLMVLAILLLVSLITWVISAQRKEASARGEYLEAFAMAEKLGVEKEFAVLKNSPDIGRYIAAMHACDQCRSSKRCREFLDSNDEADAIAAKRFCPNAELFMELRESAH